MKNLKRKTLREIIDNAVSFDTILQRMARRQFDDVEDDEETFHQAEQDLLTKKTLLFSQDNT